MYDKSHVAKMERDKRHKRIHLLPYLLYVPYLDLIISSLN